MSRPDLTLAREFEAALAWWHTAGVDCDFSDDVTALLGELPAAAATIGTGAPEAGAAKPQPRPAPAMPPQPAPAAPRRDLLGESPPADLPAFRQWWMTDPALAATRAFPRVPPRGPAGAALMVLVPQPEEGDRESLLSGAQGRLLARMLAAMGVDEASTYIAAALPCHTPLADFAALAAGGMDAVTAHHIALVRPARLLVFGTGLAGLVDPAARAGAEQHLREINCNGGTVPAFMSEALDALMDMPRLKARFWRRWMEWSATV